MKIRYSTKTICTFLVTLMLALSFYVTSSQAGTYYVSSSGSGSTCSLASPCAMSYAFTHAASGDVWYFRGGTYTISSALSSNRNNGTSNNPITFKAYPGESPILDSSSWDTSSVFSVDAQYWVFDGINVKTMRTFWSNGYNVTGGATGFTFKNATGQMTSDTSDNGGIVQVYAPASHVTVANCSLTGAGSGGRHNTALIWIDEADHLTITNNIINNSVSGVYFKHSNAMQNDSNTISYNYFTNNNWGIHSVGNYVVMEHNVLKGNNTDIELCDDGGAGLGGLGCQYNTINHNTMTSTYSFSCDDQGNGTCLHTTYNNNISTVTNQYAPYTAGDASKFNMTADYNLYTTGTVVHGFTNNYTLASWKTYLGGDAHSLSAAPIFTGGLAPSTITGFALTSGSPGHNAASDGTDMGANVTFVGPSGLPGGQIRPSPPALQ